LDKELISKLDDAGSEKEILFTIGKNTTFTGKNDTLQLNYTTKKGLVIKHYLLSIEQLAEGNNEFITTDDMEKYLPILTAIETAIDQYYIDDPNITDKMVLAIIERMKIKPDIRQDSKLINDIQANIRLALSIKKFSKKEVAGCIKMIVKSIKKHHYIGGPTGYLDFIRKSYSKIIES
jgi:hypothetical protein